MYKTDKRDSKKDTNDAEKSGLSDNDYYNILKSLSFYKIKTLDPSKQYTHFYTARKLPDILSDSKEQHTQEDYQESESELFEKYISSVVEKKVEEFFYAHVFDLFKIIALRTVKNILIFIWKILKWAIPACIAIAAVVVPLFIWCAPDEAKKIVWKLFSWMF